MCYCLLAIGVYQKAEADLLIFVRSPSLKLTGGDGVPDGDPPDPLSLTVYEQISSLGTVEATFTG